MALLLLLLLLLPPFSGGQASLSNGDIKVDWAADCGGISFLGRPGGSNYTNRLAAAQAAPRFKLWLECGRPKWEEFHRGLSDAAKAELKRQGRRAREAEERRMYEEGRRLEFLVKKGSDSITRADKWEHKANTLMRQRRFRYL